MKKAFLIYNPYSGEGSFSSKIDMILQTFQKHGWQITIYCITNHDISKIINNIDVNYFDAIFAAGGDGTIHHVINSLQNAEIDLPLGVIPAGTANDLAYHLGFNSTLENNCELLMRSKISFMDLGYANDVYFMNVASAGLLTEVAYDTNIRLKQIAGKFAYYMKGVEKIPLLKPVAVRFESENKIIEENILLFLVMNGSTAGGFKNLAPNAKINDGKLDILIFKYCSFTEFINLFFKLLKGEHYKSDKLIYFQTEDKIKINCFNEIPTDLDGEQGPKFPLSIGIKKKCQRIFTA
jgi:YegS/Rv2252/BmrU family lipid kinase